MEDQLTKPKQYKLSLKHTQYVYDESDLSLQMVSFFEDKHIPEIVKLSFFDFLFNQDTDLKDILNHYFDHLDETATFTPLFIVNERLQEMVVILADLRFPPDQPGEYGSVLGFVRKSFYGEEFLCSDCSGQLSCSSCAVEVVKGKPSNFEMRDEEYDMLSIDPEMTPTAFSRLSCQTIVGDEPLMILIKQYG